MKTSFLLVALLAGCASVAPSQFYRPANYAGAPWTITGEYSELSRSVDVSVNGQKVASGGLSLLSGSAEFTGVYETKPVEVSCATTRGLVGGRRVGCQVFVSGERAANLSF